MGVVCLFGLRPAWIEGGSRLKKRIGMMVGVLALGSLCMPVFGDEWDLSEDGKHWQYYGYTDEPLKDEWIEDGGKTYYVDSNGYMKTGWVTNSNDGNRYYMGEDGAMVKNAFTPDDRYVGPEGIMVEKYDTYRKAVKAEINKAARQKRASRAEEGERERIPYFLLADLNKDEYRDLVVMYAYGPEEDEKTSGETAGQGINAGKTPGLGMDGQTAGQGAEVTGPTGGNLVEIVVWDAEEQKFQLAAEFDETGEGEYSTLYADPDGEGVWLEIAEHEESLRLFQMEVDTSRFRGGRSFTVDLDEWGGAVYFIDGSAESKADWDEEMIRAKLKRGNMPLGGYLPVNNENIKKEVDRELEERELYLWE